MDPFEGISSLDDVPVKHLTEGDFPDLSVDRVAAAFGSTHHIVRREQVDPEEKLSLLGTIKESLPSISISKVASSFRTGSVYLNGRPVSGECSLIGPSIIEYFESHRSIDIALSGIPLWRDEWVIHQHSHYLVIFKPARLPSMPAKEQKVRSLRNYVAAYMGHRVHFPSRLDMSTSGLLLVSSNPLHHKAIQGLYEQRRIRKAYLLASLGPPLSCPVLASSRIAKHPLHKAIRRTSEHEGVDALTYFFPITSQSDSLPLYLALPLTGRTHQIRVHAAALGIPIVGDNFYGGAPACRLHLMSTAIGFHNPSSKEWVHFTVPLPLSPSWVSSESLDFISSLISNPHFCMGSNRDKLSKLS